MALPVRWYGARVVSSAWTVADDLALALAMADAADSIAMAAFRNAASDVVVKLDGTIVTATDVAVEETLRSMVRAHRPDDGFVGEEVGATGSDERRWIVDGIDGTSLFVERGHWWGTQIALESAGSVTVAVSSSPALRRRWSAGRGSGSWVATASPGEPLGPAVRASVSIRTDLRGAMASCVPPLERLHGPWRDLAEQLTTRCTYVPPDAHPALLVAEGRIDACVQPGGGPWDLAATSLIVEEAGGTVSDLGGRLDIWGGGPLLYTNGAVHAAALDLFDHRSSPVRIEDLPAGRP